MKMYASIFVLIIAATLRYMTYDDSSMSADEAKGDKSNLVRFSNNIKNSAQRNIQRILPSPHSELLLGTLVGLDNLDLVPRYNDVLLRTGTVHVVVVSGFNISLINNFVLKIIGTKYKFKNMLIALTATFGYAVICGLEPPVVRSWIMGGIASWGQCMGRQLEGIRVLIVSALVMLLINPTYLDSLSFQLSFMATLSLMTFTPYFSWIFDKKLKLKGLIFEDLSTTLAAQVLVWPLISNTFGRVSVISPLVNSLILWTIPLATVLGGVLLFLTYLSPLLSFLFSGLVYVPLDIFIRVVTFFGKISWADLSFELSGLHMISYYLFIFLLVWALKRFFSLT